MGLSAKCLAQGQSNTNAPEGLALSGLWFLLHHRAAAAAAACGVEDIQLRVYFSSPFLLEWEDQNAGIWFFLRFRFVCARIISYTLLTNRLAFHLSGTHMHTETNSLSFALSNMLCFSLFNLLGNSLAARASVEGQKGSQLVLKSCSWGRKKKLHWSNFQHSSSTLTICLNSN